MFLSWLNNKKLILYNKKTNNDYDKNNFILHKMYLFNIAKKEYNLQKTYQSFLCMFPVLSLKKSFFSYLF